jgi:hypothetical protein
VFQFSAKIKSRLFHCFTLCCKFLKGVHNGILGGEVELFIMTLVLSTIPLDLNFTLLLLSGVVKVALCAREL